VGDIWWGGFNNENNGVLVGYIDGLIDDSNIPSG
jgi:hypothetical protein